MAGENNGEITAPSQVKLFVGMLSQDISLFEQLTGILTNIFGPSDIESPVWSWEHTTYYQEEMGAGLKRKFIFFEKLINPGDIAEIKLKTVELEKQYLNESSGRKINLDPGYLDAAKLVLVSTKNFSHRIYLSNGIYGEVTLIYSGKNYRSLPYTFPDYKTEEYLEVFKKARERYKEQVK
ncbi:MAG TPA: DUF4416 family protein [Nitrospirae bacterium]|nr:hypothetical protein BMS3Abin06_00469 [bacterium BMS3Abin06]HDH13678.1 DUF4416 family protein [Nitrospirota bacterium]HDZ02735.1 DUF4416 family protein [Nitrospirota bacterium]